MTWDELDPEALVAWDVLNLDGRWMLRRMWDYNPTTRAMSFCGVPIMVCEACHAVQADLSATDLCMRDDYGHLDGCVCRRLAPDGRGWERYFRPK